MELDEAALRIQHAYPRIYWACHRDHQNARTTEHQLSQRDAAILAHLSATAPTLQSALARHLGLAKSTLSEALKWLASCGYVERRAVPGPGREVDLLLTPQGRQAMSDTSVLDADRLVDLLQQIDPANRERAVAGLELLASASARLASAKRKVNTT